MEWGNPWAFLGFLALPLLWWWGRARFRESPGPLAAAAIGLRAAFLLTILAALAMPTLLLPERQTDWLFLIDRSHSLPSIDVERLRRAVEEAGSGLSGQDRLAVLSFAADTTLEVPFAEDAERQPPADGGNGSETALQAALDAGLAEFEHRHRQRIVLLSDGNETLGDARRILPKLQSRGVRLHAIAPPPAAQVAEVRLENLVLPPLARQGDAFTLEAVVHSSQPAKAVLQLFRDTESIGQYRVELAAGRNVFPVDLTASEEGRYLFRAGIESTADRRPENNIFQRFMTVEGGGRVLLISGAEADSGPLRQALEVQGMRVTTGDLARLPRTMTALREYEALIFDNVAGFELSQSHMEMMEAYVRDFGGGFVMIGGEHSFGGGGYHDSPLEALLPVDMAIDEEVRLPTVAMVIVLDRSDSMGGEVSGSVDDGSKLEVAKLASYSAMQLLNPRDRVGLVAFDTRAEWIVPMIEAQEREAIETQLGGLHVGGGTDLYVGLNQAVEQLGQLRAHKKHIIALSDGLTPVRRYEELVKGAAGSRITVSTVALGDGADEVLLRNIANWGHGRFYATNDPLKIPRIFTTETMMASQGLVKEREFRPAPREAHEILEGLPLDALPPLSGYVVTSAKPSARVVLSAADDDPLLAVRQYGLGRSVAFTSDLSTGWGRAWVDWPEYPRVVTQLVRWAAQREAAGNLEVDLRMEGRSAEVRADLYDDSGRFLNRYTVAAQVTGPDQTEQTVTLEQAAPGRYRGRFPLERSGQYLLSISGTRGDRTVGPRTMGLAVPYGAEYRHDSVDVALLTDLAEGSGGRYFPGDDPDAALAEILAEEGGDPVRKPIWPYLVVAGLLLFLSDIALRQIGWMPHIEESESAESNAG